MSPLFALVVKDGRRGLVRDTIAMITQVAGCDESMKAFRRMDGINVLKDLVVGRSGRARQNATTILSNLIKSDKAVRDVREVDEAKVVVKALADDDNRVSAGGRVRRRHY